jgi:hypothetical protein
MTEIIIPASVEVLAEYCFSGCKSLYLVKFEAGSRLSRIEKQAFFRTGLVDMILPVSVEVLGDGCFYGCRSLSSVTFESGSRLREVGRDAFSDTLIRPTFPIKECCLW